MSIGASRNPFKRIHSRGRAVFALGISIAIGFVPGFVPGVAQSQQPQLSGPEPAEGATAPLETVDNLRRCLSAHATLDPSERERACDALAASTAASAETRRLALLARAELRAARGAADDAKSDIAAAAAVRPPSAAALIVAARLAPSEDAALEAYQAAVDAASADERAAAEAALAGYLSQRSFDREAAGDVAGAIADIDRLLERVDAPRNRHQLLFRRGVLRQTSGDVDAALADWAAAIDADDGQPWAYAQRGAFRASTGDESGAIEDLTAAFDRRKADPSFVLVGDTLIALLSARGRQLAEEGDVFNAARTFRTAFTIAGDRGLVAAKAHFSDQARSAPSEAEAQRRLGAARAFFEEIGADAAASEFQIALAGRLAGAGAAEAAEAALDRAETMVAAIAPNAAAAALRLGLADVALTLGDAARAGAAFAAAAEAGAAPAAIAGRWLAAALADPQPERRRRFAKTALDIYETVERPDAADRRAAIAAAIAAGETQTAAELARRETVAAPTSPLAWRTRADALLAHGDAAGAREGYGRAAQAALQANDLNGFLSALRGRARVWPAANAAEAIADWTRILAIAPRDREALRARATLRADADDPEGALGDLSVVLDAAPDDIAGLAQRGALLVRLRRDAEALQDLDRALSLDETNLESRIGRGRAYLNLGEFARGLADFDAALAQASQASQSARVDLHRNRGVALLALDRDQDALAALEDAAAIAPSDPITHLWRGRAHARLGDAAKAMADWEFAFPKLTSEIVATYQRLLQQKGFAVGEADGLYGPATNAALAECAENRCL